MIEPKLIHAIIEGYTLPPMGIHGLPHWARVLDNGLRLASQTGAKQQVVAFFAVFHDSRRRNEEVDLGHGARGGTLASQLRAQYLNLADDEFELLVYACAHHTDGTVDGDVTVQTCWDADRLDLPRVGITPMNERLCTSAAKNEEIQAWSRERSISDYTPDYVVKDWQRGTEHHGVSR